MSATLIWSIGLQSSLTIGDMDEMTAGMILDLMYWKSNQAQTRRLSTEQGHRRAASQADFDSF